MTDLTSFFDGPTDPGERKRWKENMAVAALPTTPSGRELSERTRAQLGKKGILLWRAADFLEEMLMLQAMKERAAREEIHKD